LAAAGSPKGRRLKARHADLLALKCALDTAFPEQLEQTIPSAVEAVRPATTRALDPRVSPLGGATEIGGSALLIEVGGRRVLVDAGLRPNGETLAAMGPPKLDVAVREGIDLLVITHAHADHAGYVPALVSRSPRTEIVCSPGTAALLPTMWQDSRRVLEKRLETEAALLGGATGLYSEAEVDVAVERLQVRSVDRPWQFAGMELILFPAGHVLGATGLALRAGNHRIVVTGDISDRDQASVASAHLPGRSWRQADLLVIESTYCHDDHRSRSAEVDDFVAAVGDVVGAGGRVLIPAFGLGRAQEVALILRERLPGVPVLVDGIARDISRIYEEHARSHGRDLQILGGDVRPVRNRMRVMEIEAFEEGVVITTSGMLAGGPAVPWAAAILPDPDAALFLCGYQDEESPGRMLQSLSASGSPQKLVLGLGDETITVDVRARIETYHLSAHADRSGLISIIDRLAPAETMLVHGYPRAQRQFMETLRVHGARTTPTRNWTPRQ
jgi:Cft2 family RNA processing exonuclease